MTAAQIQTVRYLRNGMATGATVEHTRADGSIIVRTGYGLVLVATSGQRFNDKQI